MIISFITLENPNILYITLFDRSVVFSILVPAKTKLSCMSPLGRGLKNIFTTSLGLSPVKKNQEAEERLVCLAFDTDKVV